MKVKVSHSSCNFVLNFLKVYSSAIVIAYSLECIISCKSGHEYLNLPSGINKVHLSVMCSDLSHCSVVFSPLDGVISTLLRPEQLTEYNLDFLMRY